MKKLLLEQFSLTTGILQVESWESATGWSAKVGDGPVVVSTASRQKAEARAISLHMTAPENYVIGDRVKHQTH